MKILSLLVIWMESPWGQFIDCITVTNDHWVAGIFWRLSGVARQAALTRVGHEGDSSDSQQKPLCPWSLFHCMGEIPEQLMRCWASPMTAAQPVLWAHTGQSWGPELQNNCWPWANTLNMCPQSTHRSTSSDPPSGMAIRGNTHSNSWRIPTHPSCQSHKLKTLHSHAVCTPALLPCSPE